MPEPISRVRPTAPSPARTTGAPAIGTPATNEHASQPSKANTTKVDGRGPRCFAAGVGLLGECQAGMLAGVDCEADR